MNTYVVKTSFGTIKVKADFYDITVNKEVRGYTFYLRTNGCLDCPVLFVNSLYLIYIYRKD